MTILLLACSAIVESDCERACDIMYSDCEGMVYYDDPVGLCRDECALSERPDDWAECVFGRIDEESSHEECVDAASECDPSPCEGGAQGGWTYDYPWSCSG